MSEDATPLEAPVVGDVTIVPYKRVREALGCPADAGLLMEDRRNVARVWFPSMDRTFWLSHEHLDAIPEDRLPLHPLVRRLHRIGRLVDAVYIEIQDDDEGIAGEYLVYATALTPEMIRGVEAEVGEHLDLLRIEGGSSRRVRLRMRFSDVPATPEA